MNEKIERDFSLKSYNTFRLPVHAKFFVEATSLESLTEAISWAKNHQQEIIIIGGGSNVLLTGDFDGLVVLNRIMGRELLSDHETEVIVKFGAGENWHHVVLFCIDNGWGGVENLSLIPGTVGAAPMQNIGAYGVELEDVFVSLEALNRATGVLEVFDRDACQFGYRQSVFKKEKRDQYVITSVTLRLKKDHQVNTSYGAIQETLSKKGIHGPSIKDVSDAVIEIRRSKLPDPQLLGNAGSFFKNPIISHSHFETIQGKYPDVPSYSVSEGVKVPAGWLIETCGWKGKVIGDVGVHKQQALVIVNYGKGTGRDIVNLANEIRESVQSEFSIDLQPEVNFI